MRTPRPGSPVSALRPTLPPCLGGTSLHRHELTRIQTTVAVRIDAFEALHEAFLQIRWQLAPYRLAVHILVHEADDVVLEHTLLILAEILAFRGADQDVVYYHVAVAGHDGR